MNEYNMSAHVREENTNIEFIKACAYRKCDEEDLKSAYDFLDDWVFFERRLLEMASNDYVFDPMSVFFVKKESVSDEQGDIISPDFGLLTVKFSMIKKA